MEREKLPDRESGRLTHSLELEGGFRLYVFSQVFSFRWGLQFAGSRYEGGIEEKELSKGDIRGGGGTA